MENKAFWKVYITTYVIGITPFLIMFFLINDALPSLYIKNLYNKIIGNFGWSAGLISSRYPITSTFYSLYNCTGGAFGAAVAWMVSRKSFTGIYDNEVMKDFSTGRYLKSLILFIVPFLSIGLLMAYIQGDLSNAVAWVNMFSKSRPLYTTLYLIFVFPMWLFMCFLAMLIFVESTIHFIKLHCGSK